ncbi:PLP-dependent aminotransferase family protein [Caulobacter radicis]|uniref:aminotransferase-like domain-containing protein n=1 Tax=Caulobacter radicis TaxID=2172650 RepID=UPI000D5734F8|nr:PLP-dependent aminotransferase family protein [Caulobacter radicis]PVM92676.1 PLP-dependent aminotransferase family protein [Caulobacter radicis]
MADARDAVLPAGAAWLRRVAAGEGPIYRRVFEALRAAVADGELSAGEQLPPQRTVAALLGVDFTTVTRAYALAREQGLVEGAAGRGTFVRRRAGEEEAGLVDLSMNLPPPPQGLSLAALLRETTAGVLARTDPATLMAYHAGPGSLAQRAAGAAWMAPGLGAVDPERVVVCAGAQAALSAILAVETAPGDAVIVEALTYPGLLAALAARGVRAVACPMDGEGIVPEALAELLAATGARLVVVTPTWQNPTTATMSAGRRAAVVEACARAGARIVEDDAYGRLPDPAPTALAALAPERVWHVATLAKALTPGLRIAYVATPDAAAAGRLAAAGHALCQMPAPLMAAVATTWIRDGTAEAILAGVRAEAAARRMLAAQILPEATGPEGCLHVWLDRAARGSAEGLTLAPASLFAAPGVAAEGARLSLGAPGKQAVLASALRRLAGSLA